MLAFRAEVAGAIVECVVEGAGFVRRRCGEAAGMPRARQLAFGYGLRAVSSLRVAIALRLRMLRRDGVRVAAVRRRAGHIDCVLRRIVRRVRGRGGRRIRLVPCVDGFGGDLGVVCGIGRSFAFPSDLAGYFRHDGREHLGFFEARFRRDAERDGHGRDAAADDACKRMGDGAVERGDGDVEDEDDACARRRAEKAQPERARARKGGRFQSERADPAAQIDEAGKVEHGVKHRLAQGDGGHAEIRGPAERRGEHGDERYLERDGGDHHDGIGAHRPHGGKRLLQVGVHPVEGKRERQGGEVERDLADVLLGEGANVVQRDQRLGEHDEKQREWNHEEKDLVRARGEPALETLQVAFRVHLRYLGEHGGGDGHGQKRIGKREPQAGIGDDRRPVFDDGIRCRVLHRHHDKPRAHDKHGGHADREGFFQGGIAQVHMEAQLDAVALEGGKLDGHLDEDAERVAYGDDQLRHVGIARRDEGVEHEGGRDDDVVENGRGAAPEIIARSVEQSADDGGKPVEDDLYREEAEEEHRIVHAALVAHEALREHERRGEQGAQQRHQAEGDERDAHDIAGVFVAAAFAQAVFHRQVDGQKRRDEHAAHDKLVEHVRQVVRDLVRACQHGRPEREGHGPRAHEAGDAGYDDEEADESRRGSDACGRFLRRWLVL